MPVPETTPLLELRGVTKNFAGVPALSEVSLALRAGEVHALIGENGAGKSTLINVLSGAFEADAGELRWRGEPVRFASPLHAARRGLAVVHQESQLIGSMTGLDNLYLGEPFPTVARTPWIALAAMRRRADQAWRSLGLVGVVLPLDALVAELSATQRTWLALLRCMMSRSDQRGSEMQVHPKRGHGKCEPEIREPGMRESERREPERRESERRETEMHETDMRGPGECAPMCGPEILVLDEPTAALTSRDAQQLLGLVDALRRRGTAVLYVSHRLDEVLQIADRITVLRNGRRVVVLDAAQQTQAGLVEAMSGPGNAGLNAGLNTGLSAGLNAGHNAGHVAARAAATHGPALLELRDLATVDGRVRSVGLTVHEGELLGVYGLAGSGRTELLETLVGLRARRAGAMRLVGVDYRPDGPRQAARRGVVLIPEDRRADALVPGMRVRENLTLPFLRRLARAGWIDRAGERQQALVSMRALDIKATGPEQTIAELSGGNQQKVVFARALAMAPKLLVCDEPTQAVDVATRRAIHALLQRQRSGGGAVLLVTSDLGEMLELADRIVVLREGRSVATLDNRGLASADVLRWCFGTADLVAPPVPAKVAA